jgi:hypothetical protein
MKTFVWSLTEIDVVDIFTRFIKLNLIYNINFRIDKGTLKPLFLDIPFVRALEAMNEIALHRFMDS